MFMTSIHTLEKKTEISTVQRVTTRTVPGMEKIPYDERLRLIGMPSLVYRRKRGDAIEVYTSICMVFIILDV
jgi:hypothetical protein